MFETLQRKWARFLYRRHVPQLAPKAGGYGRMGQDIFIAELLGQKRGGVFVDIGASDGVTLSNTAHFERELGWTGLAVEPIPEVFGRLSANRKCALFNGCVTDREGTQSFSEVVAESHMLSGLSAKMDPRHARRIRRRIAREGGATLREIEVTCMTWPAILAAHGISAVDYLSLDTEGGELDILKTIDFGATPVRVISVENNYFGHDIHDYLCARGFRRVGAFNVDEIYVSGPAS